MKSLVELLEQVPDHRRAQGMKHPKVPLLLMIILANISGSYGYREMAQYMKQNEQTFKKMFSLKHKVIKHVALRTFIQKLDFDSLVEIFRRWMKQFIIFEADSLEDRTYHIDGKALNSTVNNCHDSLQNYYSLVSLFNGKTGIVHDMEKMELKKDHEIAAAQKLIERIEMKGIVITADALHCQKKLWK